MGKRVSGLALAMLALGCVSLWTGQGAAQDAAQKKPPISVGGYAYKYVPTGQIYSFTCEVKDCVPGSKVSYQLYAPEKNPDFEKFKKSQEMVEAYFKKNPAIGTSVKFGTPKRTDGEHFTVFENSREQQLPDGGSWFTRSMLIHGKNVTISLISSSKEEKVRDANQEKFLAGLMLWGQAPNNDPE